MKDKNKTERIDIWEVKNIDDFLRNICKDIKPQTDAITEKQKMENVIEVMMRAVKSVQQK